MLAPLFRRSTNDHQRMRDSCEYYLNLINNNGGFVCWHTMDSGVRLQRYIIREWGDIYGIPLFKKGFAATLIAVTSCLLLAFGAGGASGSGGLTIWPLFGSTNQILAGMTLLVISVMLIKLGRPARYTMMPIVCFVTSCWAAIIKLMEFWAEGIGCL